LPPGVNSKQKKELERKRGEEGRFKKVRGGVLKPSHLGYQVSTNSGRKGAYNLNLEKDLRRGGREGRGTGRPGRFDDSRRVYIEEVRGE
jgi:hypothetical protein